MGRIQAVHALAQVRLAGDRVAPVDRFDLVPGELHRHDARQVA